MRYSFQLGAQVRKIISVHSRSTPPVAVNVVDGRKGERAFIMEPLNSLQKWNYAINQCRVLLLGCICLKTSFFFTSTPSFYRMLWGFSMVVKRPAMRVIKEIPTPTSRRESGQVSNYSCCQPLQIRAVRRSVVLAILSSPVPTKLRVSDCLLKITYLGSCWDRRKTLGDGFAAQERNR